MFGKRFSPGQKAARYLCSGQSPTAKDFWSRGQFPWHLHDEAMSYDRRLDLQASGREEATQWMRTPTILILSYLSRLPVGLGRPLQVAHIKSLLAGLSYSFGVKRVCHLW